jgi:hypothetical protein
MSGHQHRRRSGGGKSSAPPQGERTVWVDREVRGEGDRTPQRRPQAEARERTPGTDNSRSGTQFSPAEDDPFAAQDDAARMPPPPARSAAPAPTRAPSAAASAAAAPAAAATAMDDSGVGDSLPPTVFTYKEFFDDPGVLHVFYPEELSREDRVPIYPIAVGGAYTVGACAFAEAFPKMPQAGIRPDRPSKGKFSVYICYEAARDFARRHPTLQVEEFDSNEDSYEPARYVLMHTTPPKHGPPPVARPLPTQGPI